jgi:hypothetical protein
MGSNVMEAEGETQGLEHLPSKLKDLLKAQVREGC